MRRRASLSRIVALATLILPMRAASLPPDVPDTGRAKEPPATVDPDRTAPDAGRDPPGDEPGRSQAHGAKNPDPPAREGAGSMEPSPGPGQDDRVKEDAAERQHREWVQSIWNSP